MVLLQSIVQVTVGPVPDVLAQLGADGAGVAVVAVGRDPFRGDVGHRQGRLRRPFLMWTALKHKGLLQREQTALVAACSLFSAGGDPVGRALMPGLQLRPQPLAMVGVRLRAGAAA